jgi:hypothetical protein
VERDEAEVDAIIQRMKKYIREDPDADGTSKWATWERLLAGGRILGPWAAETLGAGAYREGLGPSLWWSVGPWDRLSSGASVPLVGSDPLVGPRPLVSLLGPRPPVSAWAETTGLSAGGRGRPSGGAQTDRPCWGRDHRSQSEAETVGRCAGPAVCPSAGVESAPAGAQALRWGLRRSLYRRAPPHGFSRVLFLRGPFAFDVPFPLAGRQTFVSGDGYIAFNEFIAIWGQDDGF